MKSGRCVGVGVGPGDPELLTIRAAREMAAADVVASFAGPGRRGIARGIAAETGIPRADQAEVVFVYPLTTGRPAEGTTYEETLGRFYDAVGEELGGILDEGRDVAVLCEGDPMLHGSFIYVHERLVARGFDVDVVPGVPAMAAAGAALKMPLACREEILTVATATQVIADPDLFGGPTVVIKVGRHLGALRKAAASAGVLDRAWYLERVSMGSAERIEPLGATDAAEAPYFSMVVVPSARAGD